MSCLQKKIPQLCVAGLLLCLTAAVLAFGGNEPLSWSAVELLAFLLLGFGIWAAHFQHDSAAWPWRGPAILLAYVAAQAVVVHTDLHLVREQLLRLSAYLCIFSISVFAGRSKTARKQSILGLLGLGVFEALYGLIQYVTGWYRIFAYKKVFYTAHATGTYINPNHFAGLLEMILPLAFGLALCTLAQIGQRIKSPSQDTNRFPREEWLAASIFFSFCVLLLFGAILFSRSRTGIISAIIGSAATGVTWILSGRRRSRTALFLVLCIGAACIFGLWIDLGPVLDRYATIQADSAGRFAVWKDSLELIRAHPLLGTGPGTFASSYTRVQSTVVTRAVDHAHNDYLEIAAEWGIPGAILVFGLILRISGRALLACFRETTDEQRLAAAGACGSVLALLLHSVADFNLQIPANALVFAAILGLAYSAGSDGAFGEPSANRRPLS